MDEVEARLKADEKIVADEEAPGKTGLMIGLIIGLIGAIGIGLYIYKKKNQHDDQPEGGNDDSYQMFIDQELNE